MQLVGVAQKLRKILFIVCEKCRLLVLLASLTQRIFSLFSYRKQPLKLEI